MDQVKEILRQAIKYRFWIAVGISALLPMIAYAVGSDPIKKKAAEETKKIEDAEKNVKAYAGGVVPNDQYKPLVDRKKEVLSKDVNASWKKLYARQAPLLTWPTTVEDTFPVWGCKWPENVDASKVRIAIVDYVTAYPNYVNKVYQTFRPFDPVEGTGVVAAPPEAALLKPAPFTTEGEGLPTLGKVWAAQERLWIQRTLLQVVDEVNHEAKDWDSALIKQVNLVDVGMITTQDQVSIASGGTLEEAPPLSPPGDAAAPAPAADPAAGAAADPILAGGGAPPANGGGMPGMEPGMGMGMGGQQDPSQVFYIKTDPPSKQYKILPFQMTVLINQDHIQDFLVGLENSPLTIQVAEFDMSKPAQRVVKPEKGGMLAFGGDMSMMYGRMMMPGMEQNVRMFGGPSARMDMPGMMPGMEGAGGRYGSTNTRTGVDKRGVNRQRQREEEEKKYRETAGRTIHDPYYNIIELNVYGQARFYNPPPVEPPAQPSESATAAAPADAAGGAPAAGVPAAGAPEAGTPAAGAPEAGTPAPAPAAEPAKAEEAAPKAEGETPKTDEPAKAEGETPKQEEPAAATPKSF
jgi:hypothetical protein